MGPEIAPIHNHVVVFGERHLRYVLLLLMNYYNDARTHLSLKNARVPCAAETARAHYLVTNLLGGLHHLAGDLRFTHIPIFKTQCGATIKMGIPRQSG